MYIILHCKYAEVIVMMHLGCNFKVTASGILRMQQGNNFQNKTDRLYLQPMNNYAIQLIICWLFFVRLCAKTMFWKMS